jgi:hypothetical protein
VRTILNVAYFVSAVWIAWALESIGSTGWAEAFVNDRVWSVPFGWVSWPDLISWLFLLLLFLALGVAITWFVRSTRVLVWAGALGAVFSVLQMVLSHHGFAEHAGFYAYFWAYGRYLIPPVGSLVGGWMALRLSASRSAKKPTASRPNSAH